MRLGKGVFACLLACMSFLFIPLQVSATELTEEEVAEFRALLEERKAAKEEGAFTADEVSSIRGFLDQFKDITFGGFVENYYQRESAHPLPGWDNPAVGAKVFDRNENSFTLNNIELWLYKEAPNPGDIGFKITTNYGEQAHYITFKAATDVGGDSKIANTDGRVDDDDFTVSEGYALWNVPIGKGLTVKFGKFATWVGYEVWEAHWNPNFSRNYIYGWGIPFTNQGVGLSYPVTDKFTAQYYFVHDTDAFAAKTRGKGHGLDLAYDIGTAWGIWVDLDTFWFPTRQGDREDEWDQIYDLKIGYDPLPWLSVAHNFNLWHHDVDKGGSGSSARDGRGQKSWGYAQYFVIKPEDWYNFGLRGTYFWDGDGRAGLFGGPATGVEVTGTVNINIREKLWIRPEVRWDKITSVRSSGSSHQFHRQNDNVTGTLAVTYEF